MWHSWEELDWDRLKEMKLILNSIIIEEIQVTKVCWFKKKLATFCLTCHKQINDRNKYTLKRNKSLVKTSM